jgi:hypothetical protein
VHLAMSAISLCIESVVKYTCGLSLFNLDNSFHSQTFQKSLQLSGNIGISELYQSIVFIVTRLGFTKVIWL